MIIRKNTSSSPDQNVIYLISDPNQLARLPLSEQEQNYIREAAASKSPVGFGFNRYTHHVYVQMYAETTGYTSIEKLRREGDQAVLYFLQAKQTSAVLFAPDGEASAILAFAEGFALGSYKFIPYKQKEEVVFNELRINGDWLSSFQLSRLENLVKACFEVRDMVNEPVNVLDAMIFARKMADSCRSVGAEMKVFGRKEIEDLGMVGLLTVNRGSISEPTFSVIEWKPADARNKQPIVLVGKGLVFDTGGINLKPGNGLDAMKSDMAGGAAVFGTIYALALNKVPVHVVGLIPATDNRPGQNAMVPGDIIRMGNGKTIEILNTDAEGRLILADALLYARKYDPSLVIDMATLTGAASVAIGRFGIAGMQQGASRYMKPLMESGMRVYERIVEFPFWEEYEKDIESDIADIRNIGKGRGAGTIIAGKFLAHFIDYPWIHLDIATMAFMDSRESYMGKGATAVGVRLLYDFIEREEV
jgi:leucyl aminopeptidase